jgi:predicted Zn finger-like uncharacterized protein
MYTQCPACLTVFALDPDTLAQARGQAICGHCRERFDALASLAAQLPAVPFRQLPAHLASVELPVLDAAVYRPAAEAEAEAEAGLADEQAITISAATDEDAPEPPSFARGPRRGQWPWVALCLLLLLALGAQVGWAARERLIADPMVGGWLRRACAGLGCELPLVSAPARLHLLASDVRPDPATPGGLTISATLRNDAGFAQPYPVVSVTLSDSAGRRLAMRRFRPAEYLGDEDAQRRGIGPGDSAALVLDVHNPDGKAAAFELGFE